MQAVAERRTEMDPRVPFEASVRLAHHGFETPLDADGVNLSRRGLKMRSEKLPEIGTWLSCHFQIAPDQPPVFAEGEVVWTSQRESGIGEFGVRFAEVDPDVERWVRTLADGLDATGFEQEHSEVREVQAKQSELRLADYSMSTQLYIDELRTPILTRSAHQAHDLVILEQDLPFLRINTGVAVMQDEHQALQRGRLASVDLQMIDDMPRLTLSVVYDRASSSARPSVKSSMFPTSDIVASLFSDEEEPLNKEVPTVQEFQGIEPIAEVLEGMQEDVQEEPQSFEEMPTPVRLTSPEHLGVFHDRNQEQECRPFQVHARVSQEPMYEGMSEGGVADTSLFAQDHGLVAKVHTALAQACVKLISQLTPQPKSRTTTRIMRQSSRGMSRHLSGLSETVGTVKSMFELLVTKAGFQLPSLRTTRRRTAPPPRRQQGIQAHLAILSHIPKGWLWASVALIGLVTVIWLWRGHNEDAVSSIASEQKEPYATAPGQDLGEAEPDYGNDLNEVQAHPPTASLEGSASQGVDPLLETALPAPSYEAGPVAPTRYPNVADATARTVRSTRMEGLNTIEPTQNAPIASRPAAVAAPSTVPSTSVTGGSKTFGSAKLSHGTHFTLRMSRPITELRGTRLSDGFRVVVPGALSLDKAGPLAAAHAHVARASIYNHGDRSELNVFFEPGKSPAYRVQGKGSSLEIVIAN